MSEIVAVRQKQMSYLRWVRKQYDRNWSQIASDINVAASTINRFMRETTVGCLKATTWESLVAKYGLPPSLERVEMSTVPVVGAVQAGNWQTDYEAEIPEDYVAVPPDIRYPSIPRYAFRVRGDSMDKIYPDGTMVIAARLYDIGREPKTGDKVIVVRSSNGLEEATLKEVEIKQNGEVVLWPRSSNPEYSQAIVLPSIGEAIELPDDGCHGEYRIVGIVIQSIRPE